MDIEAVREVLKFLIVNGPARNEAEREALLAKIAAPELAPEAPPAPSGEFS